MGVLTIQDLKKYPYLTLVTEITQDGMEKINAQIDGSLVDFAKFSSASIILELKDDYNPIKEYELIITKEVSQAEQSSVGVVTEALSR